ncbi:NUDIX hydrolase [Maricaulis maris]|jgi:8-oxo-dGTP diphosphatase|uniref:NUDIX hydrolase n=1 Tax=Maricaulis maris TaxID=74318 RepID=UPI0026EB5274|nr:NUDIX hydrolase [Maricaulis maris]
MTTSGPDLTRRQPVPGAGMVVFRGDEVLLIKRGKPPYEGQWSLPGGKIEYGETAAEAASRELAEETGTTARIVGLIDVIDSIGLREPGQPGDWHYLLVDFAGVWTGGEPVAADDVTEAQFFPYAEAIARTKWDRTRDVIGRARDIVAALSAPQSVP